MKTNCSSSLIALSFFTLALLIYTPCKASHSSDSTKTNKGQNLLITEEISSLTKEIQSLSSQVQVENAYTCNFDFKPNKKGLMVNLKVFYKGKFNGEQNFQMPGKWKFKTSNGDAGFYSVEVYAKKHFNLGLYNENIANSIQKKLTLLNFLLSGKKN